MTDKYVFISVVGDNTQKNRELKKHIYKLVQMMEELD